MVSIREAMSSSPKSNRVPAAAKSSGSGREPPRARALLVVGDGPGAVGEIRCQICRAPSWAMPYSM